MNEEIVRSQFRLPESLHEKLKEAAEANRRSLNAEIVGRLQETLGGDKPPGVLPSASEMSIKAAAVRKEIFLIVRNRIIDQIDKDSSMGRDTAFVNFRDLELDLLPESDVEKMIDSTCSWLEEAGYKPDWSNIDMCFVEF
ncbi:Arc family DNA-binding protein [Carnimonas bestiolae]|uniref:Arc family DNA-binding protein n=1 Tax=Carnimonas bestiolae TaxID=3402172 RepID=UPI003F4AEFEF